MNGRNILLVAIVLFIGFFSINGFPTFNSKDIGLDKIDNKKVEVESPAQNEGLLPEDDKESNELLASEKPVVLLFSANWCGACRQFKPYFKEAQQRVGDGYRYVIVDVDKNSALADKFGIRVIPTVYIYDKEHNYRKKVDIRRFERELNDYLEHRN